MFLTRLLPGVTSASRTAGSSRICRQRSSKRRAAWLSLERLEDRLLLSCPTPPCELTNLKQLNDPTSPAPDFRFTDVWAEQIGDKIYAFSGTFENGGEDVRIFDITGPNPESWSFLTHYNPPGHNRFNDIKTQNGIGYFASNNGNGVHIVDLQDLPTGGPPTLLSLISSANGGFDRVHNLFVDGSFLYLADAQTDTVKVFDVTDPTSPAFVRDIVTTDRRVHDITVLNNRLYTSGIGSGKTDIYDVSNVGNTELAVPLLGSFGSGSKTHSNWPTPDGNYLVVARECDQCDLRIYDISDPPSFQRVSTIKFPGTSPHNPVILGNWLFVSWYERGVEVFDITVPANPVRVGFYDTFPADPPKGAFGFFGNWGVYPFLGLDKVLLSDMQSGLFILDASVLAPSPGITVSPTSGLVTTEDGGSDTFDVVLTTEPTANVTIDISSGDTTEGLVSTGGAIPASNLTLTFTPTNWNMPQTVTATGVNDPDPDGNIPYMIQTAEAVSSDPDYNGLNPADVSVTNLDNEVAAAPAVDDCNPPSGSPSDQFIVAVTGSGYQDGATADFGQRVRVQNVIFVNSGQLDVQIKIHPKAPLGPRTVSVTNPDAQSGNLAGCFTVTAPAGSSGASAGSDGTATVLVLSTAQLDGTSGEPDADTGQATEPTWEPEQPSDPELVDAVLVDLDYSPLEDDDEHNDDLTALLEPDLDPALL